MLTHPYFMGMGPPILATPMTKITNAAVISAYFFVFTIVMTSFLSMFTNCPILLRLLLTMFFLLIVIEHG